MTLPMMNEYVLKAKIQLLLVYKKIVALKAEKAELCKEIRFKSL